MSDIAHLGPVELFTPRGEESLRFFVDVLGMEEEARVGQSVYLRGWGDWLRYSLKLTEAPQGGLGHMAVKLAAAMGAEGIKQCRHRSGAVPGDDRQIGRQWQ